MRLIHTALILLFLSGYAYAQRADVTIRQEDYTSYFCTAWKVPLYVVYQLHNSEGIDCSSIPTRFSNDTKYAMATDKDYKHGLYSKGLLACPSNFTNDCERAKKAYRFYNCLPMMDVLKDGAWKTWDATISDEAAHDNLRITAGAIFDRQPYTMGDGIPVPTYFYKVVYSLNSHSYKHVLLFFNSADATVRESSFREIEKIAGYKIRYE